MARLTPRRLRRWWRRRFANPFYIVTPPFDATSAGNVVLHTLAWQLQKLGFPAFIVIHEEFPAIERPLPADRRVPYLRPAVARSHFRRGRTPIVIYPEISYHLSTSGVRVVYLLNYVGLLGGPSRLPDCEHVVAYSHNIADRSGVADVLYLPVSDPDYWTPDASMHRDIVTVYAGKYIDTHHQALPDALGQAVAIPRRGPGAPSRAELRELLRRSTEFHIFENTAVATEAALCGTPVVYHPNDYFLELIAAQEHGLQGFRPAGKESSSAAAEPFRTAYCRALAGVPTAVEAFARRMQRITRHKRYQKPFIVRPLEPST